MLRMIQENLMMQIAAAFGYLTPVDLTREGDPPRDVIWCPPEIALRRRQEQSSALDRTPEIHVPFMSFWRTMGREDKKRLNVPLAWRGAPIDGSYTRYYGLRPVSLVYQIEHWSKDHPVHELAYEKWINWTMPLPVVSFTDANGVQFDLPTSVIDPTDNSRIPEIYEIGELYRWTFNMVVQGYVITDSGEESYVPIEKVIWNIWDVPTGEAPDEATLIKAVDIDAPPLVTAWDTPAPWWDTPGQKWDPLG